MSLPAGPFIILAVAASWAGWWLLAAVVLAGCLAWVARRSTPRGRVGELLAAVREWLLFVVSVTVPAAYLASAPTSVGTAEVAYLAVVAGVVLRSEEHTSELQSRENLVCRLLLEKKKTNITN